LKISGHILCSIFQTATQLYLLENGTRKDAVPYLAVFTCTTLC